jgi:hypothetical protein
MITLTEDLGIITIAYGPKKYLKLAINLALSLELTNPDIPRAIITDAIDHPKIKKLYQFIIPINEAFGIGLIQKLYLLDYSPFHKTLFIDSDCLVINRLINLLVLCQNHSFVVLGKQISKGKWYMDVPLMLNKFGLPSIPKFNGGLYYFENSKTVKSIFNTAKELANKYDQYGFLKLRGGINEEPLLSIAMALHSVTAIEDNGTGMRTPLGISGKFNVDFLNNYCSFIKNGSHVSPIVVHFCGQISNGFHYKREVLKVKLRYYKMPKFLVRSITDVLMNTEYACFVFLKRLIKAVVRRRKISFYPTLPIRSGQ